MEAFSDFIKICKFYICRHDINKAMINYQVLE